MNRKNESESGAGQAVSPLSSLHLDAEHLQHPAPDTGPKPSAFRRIACCRYLLAEENSAAGEEIVEERVHAAIVTPEGLGARGPIVEIRREAHRGVLVRPARRQRVAFALDQSFGPHAA